jgi:hypothetical protein
VLQKSAENRKNNISVPFEATIKKINVAEGQRIPKEYLLFEFEVE